MTRVLYHANCYDGFGAAWAAWKSLDNTATYDPIAYGDLAPQLVGIDQGKLYILDFSFPRDVLLALTKEFEVIVLDHHKTAQEALAGLDFAHFDLEKSGAVLAWEYFHSNQSIPKMLLYVQDRDLWKFVLPGSQEIAAWMRSYPFDFRLWDNLYSTLENEKGLHDVWKEGTTVLRFQRQQVKLMADRAEIKMIGGYSVPVANATAFFSEVGEELCLRFPNAPFSAYYLDHPRGKRQWGLRSREGFDCSQVAKLYGGGGHPRAAGFVETLSSTGIPIGYNVTPPRSCE